MNVDHTLTQRSNAKRRKRYDQHLLVSEILLEVLPPIHQLPQTLQQRQRKSLAMRRALRNG